MTPASWPHRRGWCATPEGDTIFRTAESLRRWLSGRVVTACRSPVLGPRAELLVGRTVEAVEPRAKHLVIRFDGDVALHTHMRMTGSWHVYPAGERWRRPEHQARLVLACGERLAVCFNAPVVELLSRRDEVLHPTLRGLGPDVLVDPLDVTAVRSRARARPQETTVGEVLLDQRVVSGIGNVYRCEALFLEGVSPWAPVASVDDDTLDRLVRTAARLMRLNVAGDAPRDVGAGPGRAWVYGRAGRPCRRCGEAVRVRRLGGQARLAYWCPRCQPRPPTGPPQLGHDD